MIVKKERAVLPRHTDAKAEIDAPTKKGIGYEEVVQV